MTAQTRMRDARVCVHNVERLIAIRFSIVNASADCVESDMRTDLIGWAGCHARTHTHTSAKHAATLGATVVFVRRLSLNAFRIHHTTAESAVI